jgi:hypothetical protein
VVVTLFTVGYGDINPEQNLSKLLTIFIIIIVVILMPQQTTDLLKLFNMWSVYKKMEYNSPDFKHVIVTGHIGIQAINNLCKEIFHPDHGDSQTNTVII